MATLASLAGRRSRAAARPAPRPRLLAAWLFAVAGLVLLMVLVGGITRLTESGLSITEWNLVAGTLPPVTEAGWQQEFEKYRQTAQYRMLNRGMSLEEFRIIYFWEWFHRLLGRLIGLAYALPLLLFALARAIPAGYGPRLVALLALGGLQGAVGWWMVQSGLWTGPAVSHHRLAVHLILALVILAGLVWTALDLLATARGRPPARLRLAPALAALILLPQMMLGAWVAGLRAGHAASDWPLMNGRLLPEGIGRFGASLAGLSSDPFLVHFLHRWWALAVVVALLVLARRAWRAGARAAAWALGAAVVLQSLVGILTVVSGVAIGLAVLHQGFGALLVGLLAWTAHALGHAPAREGRRR